MMRNWIEIRFFEIPEQRLVDQTRQVRINDCISERELDEIQGKTKEGENMKEPRIEFQNTYDRRLNEDRVSHWSLVSKRGRIFKILVGRD